mgnify:CR=1 FL=1
MPPAATQGSHGHIAVVGNPNSGKTTLVRGALRALGAALLVVATPVAALPAVAS